MTGPAANLTRPAPAPAAARSLVWVGLFALLSWLGEYVHNLQELPQLTLLSPENSLPALITMVLVGVWWLAPLRRAGSLLLWLWAALHLVVGAVLTVLPLSVLPFDPPQTLEHYLVHLVYGLAQIPLLVVMTRDWLSRPKTRS
jgi:hypothetical protein